MKPTKQTIDGSKITAKQQPTKHYNVHVLTTNHITTKLTNHTPRPRSSDDDSSLDSEDDYRSGSRNVSHQQLSEDYSHPDDHAKLITDTPRFKPFTRLVCVSTTLSILLKPFIIHKFQTLANYKLNGKCDHTRPAFPSPISLKNFVYLRS